jgi:hypothetical protein
MNDLLFTALILALLYYFFYYLPKQKQREPIKLATHSQFTQTNPDPIKDDFELEFTLDNLISEITKLNQQLK